MITKNSAKCTACGVEIESTHRHDFRGHYCEVEPQQAMTWDGEGIGAKLVPVPGQTTFRFAVDGGTAYCRRVGSGYKDTSIYASEV